MENQGAIRPPITAYSEKLCIIVFVRSWIQMELKTRRSKDICFGNKDTSEFSVATTSIGWDRFRLFGRAGGDSLQPHATSSMLSATLARGRRYGPTHIVSRSGGVRDSITGRLVQVHHFESFHPYAPSHRESPSQAFYKPKGNASSLCRTE